jgi:putative inorganic carbon (hco3(-)) transporter
MRDLFVATIVFGSLPFILRRPFIGILVSAWLGYMNPHRLCYGFMLNMPVVWIVGVATLIGMLASKEAKRMVWSREIVVLAIFVAWMGITTTQALYPEAALGQYIKVLKIQVLTVLTLLMLTSEDRVRAFVWIIVVSLGFFGLKGGVFTILHGGAYRVQGPQGTFIGGNNELALALVMTIPLIRYLQLRERKQSVKVALTVAMVLCVLAAVGSQSRGALVGLLATGGIFWLKSRRKLVTAILIAAAVVVVVSVMPESWYQRMDTIDTYQQDDSAMGRINAWHMAWNMARDRFFGGGFDSFTNETFARYAPNPDNVHDSHSIYFGTLGHHGFVGLALFLILLVLTWTRCGATIRFARKRPDLTWARDLSAMIQVSLIAYISAGAFLGLMYFDYLYHLIALTVVVYDLARRSGTVAVVAPETNASETPVARARSASISRTPRSAP